MRREELNLNKTAQDRARRGPGLLNSGARPAIRFLVLSAAGLAAAIFLGACSGGPAEETVTPAAITPSPTQTIAAQPTATATPEPPAGLRAGGVLRFAVRRGPPHQDVHQSVSPALSVWGPGMAYSGLMRYQSGPAVTGGARIPECDLCSSWRQIGPLEYEFTLRPDARWQDLPPVRGRAVNANDIVFSFGRQATTGWANADLLDSIESVEAVDAVTLRIKLQVPDAEIFERLASPRSKIVSPEAVGLAGELLNGPTVGSGPWVLEEISASDATFEANRDYYEDGLPYLDGLAVQFIEDDGTRAAGLRAGLLDFDQTTYDDMVSATGRFEDIRWTQVREPGGGVEIALNTRQAPLHRLEVRELIFARIDVDRILEEIWAGGRTPSSGLNVPYPKWEPQYGPAYTGPFRDPATGAPPTLESVIGPGILRIRAGEFGARYMDTARAIARDLSGGAFTVVVEPVTTRVFADEVWIGGDYDIFVGPPPPVESLNAQLFGIYHSAGPWNSTRYSTETLDRLIERQAADLDPVSRARDIAAIQREIVAGAHRFTIASGASYWMWWNYVRDFSPGQAGADSGFLTRVWLEG